MQPISISAASYKDQNTVKKGKLYTLLVTLTLPAANRRELKPSALTPVNTTDYALLIEVPNDASFKRVAVKPALKPFSLKKPELQAGSGDLLWPTVSMLQYAASDYTRTFKVTFRVAKNAASPLVFGASVWKGGIKLDDATPVSVSVESSKH